MESEQDFFSTPPPDPNRHKTPLCSEYEDGPPSLNKIHNHRCYLYVNHSSAHRCKCARIWT